uniref:Uncharacterized protein n=1 Tax=Cacopsylla melanoneura TaxID=428564 RepID=A0A8D8V6Y1_9HEMI
MFPITRVVPVHAHTPIVIPAQEQRVIVLVEKSEGRAAGGMTARGASVRPPVSKPRAGDVIPYTERRKNKKLLYVAVVVYKLVAPELKGLTRCLWHPRSMDIPCLRFMLSSMNTSGCC